MKTLLSKYKHSAPSSHGKASNTCWKGIVAANSIVEKGSTKIVRNGHNTRFWMDTWIGEHPLYDIKRALVSLPDLYASVSDYWEERRGWKWELFQNLITDEVVTKLVGFVLSANMEEDDAIGWRWDKSNVFSIRSAYDYIRAPVCNNWQFDWRNAWNLKVPMRICMLIWLMKHGRVMTNVERAKRGITTNIVCVCCAGHAEDNNNLFRSCKEAKPVWEVALGRDVRTRVDGLDWDDWLAANLTGDKRMGLERNWPERFAVRLWWIWRW